MTYNGQSATAARARDTQNFFGGLLELGVCIRSCPIHSCRIFVIVSVLARCRLIMSRGTLGAEAWTNADTKLLALHCEQYAKDHPNDELEPKQLEYES